LGQISASHAYHNSSNSDSRHPPTYLADAAKNHFKDEDHSLQDLHAFNHRYNRKREGIYQKIDKNGQTRDSIKSFKGVSERSMEKQRQAQSR
jgi:hypothetical protein